MDNDKVKKKFDFDFSRLQKELFHACLTYG